MGDTSDVLTIARSHGNPEKKKRKVTTPVDCGLFSRKARFYFYISSIILFISTDSCLVTACQRHGSWHSNGQLFSPPLFECLGNNWIKFGTGHATFRMDCNNLKLKYSRMAVNQSCFPHDCLCRL